MAQSIEELARQIASLEERELQALLARVEELCFRQGISALSDRYRRRVEHEGAVEASAEAILQRLKTIRQEISCREYPG